MKANLSSVKITSCLKHSCFALALTGLLAAPALAQGVEREVGGGRLNWSEKTLTVTGSGATKPGGNAGQQRLMAQRAATADAYRQLAEAVNGVQVFSETVVKDFVTESDTIRLQVKAVIRGAKPVGKPRYLSDGTVEIDVSMPIFGRGSLAQAIDFGQTLEQQLSRPYSSIEHYLAFRGLSLPGSAAKAPRGGRLAQGQDYTGLIIDASGLAAEPAMGPFIVGAGKRIHIGNDIEVDPNRVVEEGPLHYVEDLDDAKQDTERVGANPLIIRAKAATGAPVRSNILLDPATAQKIITINQQAKFLEQLKVTLVL
ncbi:MAG: hypothetical protein CVV27_13330 [Candidatus Melainabacteria bacterium HGW-Melainabacteria-1]|nr:MAG: hypothetical protein CVV27_13330 [Candidatus Melainabacteria bacterium HGW-Melainabacteria-1]